MLTQEQLDKEMETFDERLYKQLVQIIEKFTELNYSILSNKNKQMFEKSLLFTLKEMIRTLGADNQTVKEVVWHYLLEDNLKIKERYIKNTYAGFIVWCFEASAIQLNAEEMLKNIKEEQK